MLLRRIRQQLGNVHLRQCSTRPVIHEPIPKPKLLAVATERWQKKHVGELKKLVRAERVSDAATYFYSEIRTPNLSIFSLLLGAVGKSGHTQLAFKLLKEMRVRSIRPSAACLTSLFNACANNREDRGPAMAHAKSLYEQMALKGWKGNQITYHAMIKAFAVHGETATCFKLLDEMQAKNISVDVDTYAHLMMACVSDKKMGFVLAVRVMRIILWNRIKPSTTCYNHFIRAAYECGCGENIDLVNKLLNDAKSMQLRDERVRQIASGMNLLDTRLSDNLISISAVPKNVEERIALIGGVEGILKQMDYFGVKPSATTYSMLLRCIKEEEDLLTLVKSIPLKKMDIGFWNQLLKKCVVEQYPCADYIQKKLYRSGLEFDILTYGILAMRINSPEELTNYMKRMEDKDIMPNEIIMSTLINNISRKFRFNTLMNLLKYCIDNDIPLNKEAVRNLATMLVKNRHSKVNSLILGILKEIRVAEVAPPRTQQFSPAILKRNKRKWDPDANDEDIEEMDRALREEAAQAAARKAAGLRQREKSLINS